MRCVGEQINRLDFIDGVRYLFQQHFNVPDLGGRVAGDINNGSRFQPCNQFYQFWMHATPWWVDDKDIRFGKIIKQFRVFQKQFIQVALDKAGVFNSIQ